MDAHDRACLRIKIFFSNHTLTWAHPKFLNQFFNDEQLKELASSTEFDHIRMWVDLQNWYTTFQAVDENGIAIFQGIVERYMLPLLASFPNHGFVNNDNSRTCLSRSEKVMDAIKFKCGQPALDSGLKQLCERIQPFLKLFIDGASSIDHNDSKWYVYLLLDHQDYILAYCSAYTFLMFPQGIRFRISQFFVIPPFQRRGLGAQLYRKVVKWASDLSRVQEITVEDPNDEFADLCLICDLDLLEFKLNPTARTAAQLLDRYRNLLRNGQVLDEEEFGEFRRDVKRYLAKVYSDCIPINNVEEKKRVLEELFGLEVARYRRLLKIP